MKKNVLYTGAMMLLFAMGANAQTDSLTPASTSTASTVQTYSNYRPKSAELIPMPEALTEDKKFPAVGQYQVTDKEGVSSNVTITLDPENKGVAWVEGLPQGKFKAYLKKSPSTYKIPAQPLESEVLAAEAAAVEAEAATTTKSKKAKTAKAPAPKMLGEGTLVFDKDANTINILIGSKYNDEDPASAFAAPTEEPAAEVADKKPVKKGKAAPKAKVAKTWHYSGTKVVAETAAPAAAPATTTPPTM